MATAIARMRRQLATLAGEDGQGLVEYALILILIAVVAILALTFLGTSLSSALSAIAGDL